MDKGRCKKVEDLQRHAVNAIIGNNVSAYLREAIRTISSRRTYYSPLDRGRGKGKTVGK